MTISTTASTTGRRHSEEELRAIAAKGAADLGTDATP